VAEPGSLIPEVTFTIPAVCCLQRRKTSGHRNKCEKNSLRLNGLCWSVCQWWSFLLKMVSFTCNRCQAGTLLLVSCICLKDHFGSMLWDFTWFSEAIGNSFLSGILVLILIRLGISQLSYSLSYLLHSISALSLTFMVNDVLATLSSQSLHASLLSLCQEHSSSVLQQLDFLQLIFIVDGAELIYYSFFAGEQV
jgi:hypothetical protein